MKLISFEVSPQINFFCNWKYKICNKHTKLDVLSICLTLGNAELLQQLKLGFKREINWSEYQCKVSIERKKQYLDYLIDGRFQGVSRALVLSFENHDIRKAHRG